MKRNDVEEVQENFPDLKLILSDSGSPCRRGTGVGLCRPELGVRTKTNETAVSPAVSKSSV